MGEKASNELAVLKAWAVKAGSIISSVASIIMFALEIMEPSPNFPWLSGPSRLNIVIHLGILTAIMHGILWTIAEKTFGWHFGAGGGDELPRGCSAVVLSSTVTLPLILVPAVYQRLTGIKILLTSHWNAAPLVFVLGAIAHLAMYGIGSDKLKGIRYRIMPPSTSTPLHKALLMELIYAAAYFGCIVFPYRVIVDPSSSLLYETLLSRTVLPGLVFFLGMTMFIVLKYPGSLTDKTWIQVRGVVSGLLLMSCFCGGMFL